MDTSPSYGVGALYHSIVEEQKKQRSEPIADLETKLHSLMRSFAERHPSKRPPQRLIIYRDGVAHNMFDEITQQEIDIARRACATLPNTSGNYHPEINFIVAQMRTKAP